MENKSNKRGMFGEYKYPIILVTVVSMILGSSVLASEYCDVIPNQQPPNTLNLPAQQEIQQPSTTFNSPAQQAILTYAKNLSATEEEYIRQIDDALFTLRQKLKHHPVYAKMNNEINVKIFMNTHVFCVWDFMNLLKRLQMYFTSVQVPWRPTMDTEKRMLRRLTNEIVLEEETDELDDAFISHFSYYVESIRQGQNGVISDTLSQFLSDVSNSRISYDDIVNSQYLPDAIGTFLKSTKDTAVHENILVTIAAFTFGREVMLPEIFTAILKESGVAKNPNLSMFVNYLDRHIELDGDYHGYLTKKMTLRLVSNQAEWDIVIKTAKNALEARIALWDDIHKRLF